MMIHKNKSQRIVLIKYIMSAPLFGLMLILSSATVNNSKAITTINNKASKLFEKSTNDVLANVPDNGKIPAGEVNPTPPKPATVIDTTKKSKVYESVETEPTFPGGINAFFDFLAKTIHYPADARRDNITGRVFVIFVVEKDGSLTNINAIRGPSQSLRDEAVRAISLSPKWNPGIQYGNTVRVQYTVPVNFTLNPTDKPVSANSTSNPVTPKPYNPNANGVYNAVEVEPSYPGGMEKFMQFLAQNIKYPAAARDNNIQGKVFVQFVVEPDGSLSDVIARRGPGGGINEEAVRAVNLSPKWRPGLQNGKPVRVMYTIPVNFTLNGDNGSPIVTLKQVPAFQAIHALILVDGVETNDISKISPDDIQSINVVKGEAAISVYGDKGKNGVVLIITKKAALKSKQ